MILRFALFWTACSLTCLATAEDPLAGSERHIYKEVDGIELALHVYTPANHRASDHRAAALFFFGGGWNGGTPTQFVPHARYLASRGMVGVVADYRVKSRHQTTPYECVKDGKSAMRWLRAHSEKLGIDPSRIAFGGGSAGGHVAAAAGTIEGINEKSDDLKVSARPDALLLFNPVYDNGPGGYQYKQFGDRYREISPMHNINKDTPPAIVFFGTEDALVPVATARAFQKAMRDAGCRSELSLFPGQPHGFFNHPQFRPNASPVFFYETMLQTDRFLTSLGFLQGEPTLVAPGFSLTENRQGSTLDVHFGDRQVAQYVFPFDPSSKESRHDTYKPFLHAFDAQGKTRLTKGPGGQFTHHRGIFLGFSRARINGQRYDLWHMKEGVQVHRAFNRMQASHDQASFSSEISWQSNEGETLLEEVRAFTFLKPSGGEHSIIDMRSTLTAIAGNAELNGDPEHAGAQFRPADNIARKDTVYTFHEEGIDPKRDRDLPWVAETFRLGENKAWHTVVILNHRGNPKGTVFSAYRDYGRFGAFPTFNLLKGESTVLRYQWLVFSGKKIDQERIREAYNTFSSQ